MKCQRICPVRAPSADRLIGTGSMSSRFPNPAFRTKSLNGSFTLHNASSGSGSADYSTPARAAAFLTRSRATPPQIADAFPNTIRPPSRPAVYVEEAVDHAVAADDVGFTRLARRRPVAWRTARRNPPCPPHLPHPPQSPSPPRPAACCRSASGRHRRAARWSACSPTSTTR